MKARFIIHLFSDANPDMVIEMEKEAQLEGVLPVGTLVNLTETAGAIGQEELDEYSSLVEQPIIGACGIFEVERVIFWEQNQTYMYHGSLHCRAGDLEKNVRVLELGYGLTRS